MNIVIVGAGSAGLITGLIFTNKIKDVKVTIVKSPIQKEIGVGESTVGSFRGFCENDMGLNYYDLLEKIQPINKLGVVFDFGKDVFHYTFENVFEKEINGVPLGFELDKGNFGFSPYSKLMLLENPDSSVYLADGLTSKSDAIHLPNQKFLSYLESVIKSRGVEIIEDHIETVERDSENNVISLNNKYHADLFIDASGFNTKISQEEWYTYKDELVNDTALVFTKETDLKPYTKATAMNNGWLWQINHLDKSVLGYVFSSQYTNEEEALNELKEKGHNVVDYKIVKFKTGRRWKHWVNNVITIGNADMFVEPLESTSLMCVMRCAREIVKILNTPNKGELINLYNMKTDIYYDNVKNFVFIHFLFSDKLDTKYWTDYRKRQHMLPGLSRQIVRYYIENGPNLVFTEHFFLDNPFGLNGWYGILKGLNVKHISSHPEE